MKINLEHFTEWKPNDRYWTFCVGSGHAALALRSDYQQLLKKACHELGFQRVRFHGILSDDMQVVTTFHDLLKVPGSKKVRTVSFYQIGVVFDALLEMGIRPFVEIGFMPQALAKKKKTVFYYRSNVSKPKYMEEWRTLIKQFAKFLKDRYGEDEVSRWYFEVWNEPDLRGFFWNGSKQDYFDLYEVTACAVKEVLPNAMVGGPATSQNRWVREFREYCEDKQIPLSFLSTHHYPGDDIGLPIFTLENLKRLLFTAKNNKGASVHDTFHKMMVREQILPLIRKSSMLEQIEKAKEEAGNVPLYYTEWNVNPTCTNELHDRCASAAFIVKHVLDAQYKLAGCAFFTFSDIFEENTFFSEPFSGSFGLMNIYGIPKPSYWAFYLLNMLGEERLELPVTHEDVEYAVFKKGNVLQFILYAQSYVQDDRRREVRIDLPCDIRIRKAQMYSVNETDTNPRGLWEKMGCPKYLSKEEVTYLCEQTKPQKKEVPVLQKQHAAVSLSMQTNEVVLLEMTMED